MKQIVCREDIQSEMWMLSQLQTDMSFIKAQLGILQDRLDFLEQKTSVINSMNTAVNVPTSARDVRYGQSLTDIADIRRAAAEAWNEQAQWISDGNWNDRPNPNT